MHYSPLQNDENHNPWFLHRKTSTELLLRDQSSTSLWDPVCQSVQSAETDSKAEKLGLKQNISIALVR